jgi:hypothetical protein
MLKVFRRNQEFDDVRQQLVDSLLTKEVTSEEYKQIFEHLEKLTVIEAASGRHRVSPDTMAVVTANLLGIAIIVSYEHVHVLGSRALSFLRIPNIKQ